MANRTGIIIFVVIAAVLVLFSFFIIDLLVTVIERDQAEEGLLKVKHEETTNSQEEGLITVPAEKMNIVEAILSQLQSGAGSEGINTRPQDEIIIPHENLDQDKMGVKIKTWRKYIIEVGVTDIYSDLIRREDESSGDYTDRLKKLIKLGNVEKIEYQIFYNPDVDYQQAPSFISDRNIRRNKIDFTELAPGKILSSPDKEASDWEFLGVRKLLLDNEAVFNNIEDMENITPFMIEPVYPEEKKIFTGDSYRPKHDEEEFYYSEERSLKNSQKRTGLQDMLIKTFVVNFAPPRKSGWYKLRFTTHTNQIINARADKNIQELSEDTPINIGTIQLTVKNLRKVNKELFLKLEKYKLPSMEILTFDKDLDTFDDLLYEAMDSIHDDDPKAIDIRSKIRLYGYIAELLNPGLTRFIPSCDANIEFDVRVIVPKLPEK